MMAMNLGQRPEMQTGWYFTIVSILFYTVHINTEGLHVFVISL